MNDMFSNYFCPENKTLPFNLRDRALSRVFRRAYARFTRSPLSRGFRRAHARYTPPLFRLLGKLAPKVR